MPTRKSDPPPIRKSIVIVPSKINKEEDNNILVEGAEEIEIAAQITVPTDGGWGWIVMICSFGNLAIIDGIVFTFGCLLPEISKDLGINEAQVVLVNSTEVGLYFLMGPIASALINRFGFRYVAMVGSVFCSLGTFAAYFSNEFVSLLIFYGVICGFGCSFISMSSGLIVGFYFEKLRAVASAIVSGGSSVGIMALYPLNSLLVRLGGWRTTILLHSGLIGLIFFLSLAFRPLVSVTITKTEEEGNPTRTVTYLPSMANTGGPRLSTASAPSRFDNSFKPNITQRLLNTVSNNYFPMAANVVQEEVLTQYNEKDGSFVGPSSGAKSKITLTVQGAVSRRQLKQVQSMVSRPNFNVQDKSQPNVEIKLQVKERIDKNKSCCAKLCHWEPRVEGDRPMYRDDAFYKGNIEKLAIYKKSMMEVPETQRTGLEYQMAVTRTVAVNDMQERRGIFTTAVRRVLATMLDPTFFKKRSFVCFCISCFFVNIGALVPYVFLPEKNRSAGVDPVHCTYFVSVISLSNLVGRLFLSFVSMKVDPAIIFTLSMLLAGIFTMLSNLSYELYYQYGYCALYGFCISPISGLRSIIIVSLYGLENLTNATGLIVMFNGLGNLISTPLAATIKQYFGAEIAFYVSGLFVTLGAVAALPIKLFHKREKALRDT